MRNCYSPKKLYKLRLRKEYFLYFCAIFILIQLPWVAASSAGKNKDVSKKDNLASVEKKWGIRPLSIQLTAAGNMLDCRFRVIDPDKAQLLMKRGDKAYIVDQTSGNKFSVPRTKVGPLRQTGSKPTPGKVYPILFSNTGKAIKSGSKITLVIGDFRMENIVVGMFLPHAAELPKAKQAKWEAIEKRFREERGACIEKCGQDQNCFDKCENAHKNGLDREFQSLIYQN